MGALANYPLRVLLPSSPELRCCFLESLRLLRILADYPETHGPLISSKFVELASEHLLGFPELGANSEAALHTLLTHTYLANILEKLAAGPEEPFLPKNMVTPAMIHLESSLSKWSEHDDFLFYSIQFLHSMAFHHHFFTDTAIVEMVSDALARLLFAELGDKPSDAATTMAQILLNLLNRHELGSASKFKLLHFLPERLEGLSSEQAGLVLEVLLQSKAVSCSHEACHMAKVVRFYAAHIQHLTAAPGLLLKSLRFLL